MQGNLGLKDLPGKVTGIELHPFPQKLGYGPAREGTLNNLGTWRATC